MIIHETEVGDDENHENIEFRDTKILGSATATYLFVFIYYSIMIFFNPQKAQIHAEDSRLPPTRDTNNSI